MHSLICYAALLFVAFHSSYAFPGILNNVARHAAAGTISDSLVEKRSEDLNKRVTFNPSQQHVSTTGTHAFVAPSSTDQRGPCPGLNAMANHGYIPHNGIATIAEFVTGTYEVFGMGVDLATFLSVYGAVFDGDLTSWSIGGPSDLISLTGLLGTPQGISGSHNKYESDVSPTRGDLYQYGNDFKVQLSQFEALYKLGKAKDTYDLPLLTTYRATRFQESISKNPYFFNAPFSGVLVQPAAYTFIYRFMSNKSAEYPEGHLNGAILKSFFSITGSDGSFKYTPGHERIPTNWYKRAVGDEYTIPYFNLDLVNMALAHPEFLSVGGNTGTKNSFVGLDVKNLTAGVYNAKTLTKGNNAMCYALELTIQEAPDFLAGLFEDDSSALGKLIQELNNVTDSLGCSKLTTASKDQFSQFPGYTKLNSDGAY